MVFVRLVVVELQIGSVIADGPVHLTFLATATAKKGTVMTVKRMPLQNTKIRADLLMLRRR